MSEPIGEGNLIAPMNVGHGPELDKGNDGPWPK